MSQYYYAADGEQFGPVDEDSLYELFASRVLAADSLVWTETFEDWKKLKDTEIGISILSQAVSVGPTMSHKNSVSESDLGDALSRRNSTSQIPLSSPESEHLWIEDDKNVWVLCQVIDHKPGLYLLRNTSNGKLIEILVEPKESNIFKANTKTSTDMTSLTYLHEPGILWNIKSRYADKQPYTFMGSVLIALNPLRQLPQPEMSDYIQAGGNLQNADSIQPHPYALAETAYQQLRFSVCNQSVVISGESGSGKTETAKIILKYLVNRISGNSSTSKAGLDSRLLRSSPILESFGNAKTGKNNNSSRFGKFMKLLYQPSSSRAGIFAAKGDTQFTLVGATVETYLLEKSRVVHQVSGERNYHIFYRLLSGLQNSRDKFSESFLSLVESVGLKAPEHFHLLNQSGCTTIDDIKEETYFDGVLESLLVVGFNESEVENIMKILYCILVLGNVVVDEVDSPEGAVSNIKNKLLLQHLSKLLIVRSESIESLITSRKVFTRGEWFTKRLTVVDAVYARDAVAKSLYESLFQYIVNKINESLSVQIDETRDRRNSVRERKLSITDRIYVEPSFIGVLDIFGFEHFVENHFEQLLINFANEAIQNTFNMQVFDAELRLYQSENLAFQVSTVPDNTGCVDLISDRASGILFILDTVCRQPKPSDERFCEELHKVFTKKNKYFLPVHPKDKKNSFVIRHYAGGVKYSVNLSTASGKPNEEMKDANSWISKNNDAYPDELSNFCQECKLSIFSDLKIFSHKEEPASSPGLMRSVSIGPGISAGLKAPDSPMASGKQFGGAFRKPTISSLFTRSMRELNALLQSTSCQFVRCIKPDRHMVLDKFDNRYVVEQLRSLGVLQTCEVLKAGLPTRITYHELKETVSSVLESMEHLFANYSEAVVVSCLLRVLGVSENIYKLGRTMVFFKAGELAYLNHLLHGSRDVIERDKAIIGMKIRSALVEVDNAFGAAKLIENEIAQLAPSISKIRDDTQNIVMVYAELESKGSEDLFDVPKDIVKLIKSIEESLGDVVASVQELNQNIDIVHAEFKSSLQLAFPSGTMLCIKDMQSKLVAVEKSVADSIVKPMSNVDLDFAGLKAVVDGVNRDLSMQGFLDEVTDIGSAVTEIDEMYNRAQELVKQAQDGANRCKLAYTIEKIKEFKSTYSALSLELLKIDRQLQVTTQNYSSGGNSIDFASVRRRGRELLERLSSISSGSRGILNKVFGISAELTSFVEEATIATKKVAASKSNKVSETQPAVSVFKDYDLVNLAAVKAEVMRLRDEGSEKGVNLPSANEIEAMKNKESEGTVISSSLTKKLLATNQRRAVDHRTDDAAQKPGSSQPENSNNNLPLPEGWKEMFDKTTNRYYYMNKFTKIRQWKRPVDEVSLKTADSNENIHNLTTEELRPVDRSSKRLEEKDMELVLHQRGSVKLTKNPVNTLPPTQPSARRRAVPYNRADKAKQARAAFEAIKYEPTVTGNVTIARLEELGRERKTGYLYKQSKLLGRWKKRYMVLDGNVLTYYDSPEEATFHAEGKEFVIQANSAVSYTAKDCCFLIKLKERDDRSEVTPDDWYLQADTAKEMDEWILAVNAHILIQYRYERNITTDFFEFGDIYPSFWRVPPSSKGVTRLPIGVRTLPFLDSPRTLEGIHPGEAVEVVQIMVNEGNTFLRLADDRGWLYEKHWKVNYDLMQRLAAEYLEGELEVDIQSTGEADRRAVFCGPSINSSVVNMAYPSGSVARITAQVTITESGRTLTFGKLKYPRGWIVLSQ